MVAQKKTKAKSSSNTPQQITVKNKKQSTTHVRELQNLMELIDIKKIVRDLVQEILQELSIMQSVNPDPIKQEESKEYVEDPMDIDLTDVESEKGLATVEGKVDNYTFSVVVDSASNKDIMPKSIADVLGVKINTNVIYNIRGVSGRNRSVGITPVSIMLAPGCAIKSDFIVIDNYPIHELLLSRATLRRYNYDLHESRKHMAVTCNGKNFFIPIVPDKNRQEKKESPVVTLVTDFRA